jgi:hypothetical protein
MLTILMVEAVIIEGAICVAVIGVVMYGLARLWDEFRGNQ